MSFKPVGSKPAPIAYLNRDSVADDADSPVIVSSSSAADTSANAKHDKGKGKAKATQEPIGTPGAMVSPTRVRAVFTTDVGPNVNPPGGHYILICNCPSKDLVGFLEMYYQGVSLLIPIFTITTYATSQDEAEDKIRGCHCPPPGAGATHTKIYVCYNDIRDAAQAFDVVQMINPNLEAFYISQTEYASSRLNGTQETTSYYDGQVIFTARFSGLSSDLAPAISALHNAVKELAAAHGDVLVIDELEAEVGCFEFRVEFNRITDAKNVISKVTEDSPHKIGVSLLQDSPVIMS